MASNLTPSELAAIVAGFNAYAATGPGGMALYKAPDGWTYYDARSSDEQGHIGGFIGRWETARFNPNGYTPTDTFDARSGAYLGPSSFDTSSPWWTNAYLPFVLVGAAFGAELAGLGSGAATAAGADGWELTNAAVMGGPGTDLAGITAAGTGATILPTAATTAATSLTSTLTQAGGAIKTALGLATAAGAATAGGGSRPPGFVPNTTYTAATPTPGTAAPGDAGGITTLLALALGFLALHG